MLLKRGSCWLKTRFKGFLVQYLTLLLLSHNIQKKGHHPFAGDLFMYHSPYSWHYCFSITKKWYITRHYTYFYILYSGGKSVQFWWSNSCHWRGLRLQLDSQPLEGDGASSWCWLSSCSCSSDRKLGNVCARGIKVIVMLVPVGGGGGGEGRGERRKTQLNIFKGMK